MKEEVLRLAYLIRAFENEIDRQFKAGIITGTVHLSKGQEYIDAQIITYFDNPLVFGNHRSHGQYIATTGDITGCYQQILQNRTQHLYYPDKFLSTGIQGGLCPVAVGNALAYKLKGIERQVLCFVGDGTLAQGVFWESVNFAALYNLNITFIIIDNGYSMSKTKSRIEAYQIANLYNIHYSSFDSNGGYYEKQGCQLIYVQCSRLCGHSCNDTQIYRQKDEKLTDILTDINYAKEAEQIISGLIAR